MFVGGRYLTAPPAALGALSIGERDLRPSYVKVALQSEQDILNHAEIQNPSHLLTGHLDWAFAVEVLLPLFLLALSYDMLSAEREAGTLAQVLAQGVSLGRLLTIRVTLRLALGLLCTLPPALIAVAVAHGVGSRREAAIDFMLTGFAVATYSLFWLLVAVAVNLFRRSGAFNATILFGVWLTIVLLAPAAIDLGSAMVYPLPSRVAQIQQQRHAADAATAQGAAALQQYLQDHPDLVPTSGAMSDFYASTLVVRQESESATRSTVDQFASQRDSRERAMSRLRYLSPALSMRFALEDLARSSDAHYRDFVRQTQLSLQRWREFFVPLIMRQQHLTPDDYDAIPTFVYQAEAATTVRQRVLSSLAALVAAAIIFILCVPFLVGRYKPVRG